MIKFFGNPYALASGGQITRKGVGMARNRLSKKEESVRAAVLAAQRQGGATVHSVAVLIGRKEEEIHVFADLGRLVAAGHLRKEGNFYLVM